MGRAALERTQPAISQQIRRLEDILGSPLLRRTASGVIALRTDSIGDFLENLLWKATA